MGTDNLFHKRKAKTREDSARREANRMPYDRVLIVCEGEKTEPYYFEEIKVTLDLDSANVEIDGSCGSSPISVVNHALWIFNKEAHGSGRYDQVYCVFDKDTHASFSDAIIKINNTNARLKAEGYCDKDTFHAIASIPCFEYWLLLHHKHTTKPYLGNGKKSAGEILIDDLKGYLPNYEKKTKGLYIDAIKKGKLAIAKKSSRSIYESSLISGDTNPSTNMHLLIEYLENIKPPK